MNVLHAGQGQLTLRVVHDGTAPGETIAKKGYRDQTGRFSGSRRRTDESMSVAFENAPRAILARSLIVEMTEMRTLHRLCSVTAARGAREPSAALARFRTKSDCLHQCG